MMRWWEFRPEVLLALTLAGFLFLRGWWRLRRRSDGWRRSRESQAAGWRLTAYLSGLIVLALALISPIDTLGGRLFSVHMVQHLLLAMLAPPLLVIANPFSTCLWGLPAPARHEVGRLLRRDAPLRHLLHLVTRPGVVWMGFVVTLLGWHDPKAYDAALRNDWIHDLEHFTFFGTAMLFWWHATRAGPRIHGRLSRGFRVVYLLSTVPVTMLTGVAIAFARTPLYTYYTTIPRVSGLTVLQDQMIGGVIMWVPGSMMTIVAALLLIAHVVRAEEEKPALPESEWASDETMIAPGWES